MKKVIQITAFSVLLSFLLTACSVQRSTGIYEFCRRLNKSNDISVIDSSGFYAESENDYNYFITLNEQRQAVLSLKTNESGTVIASSLVLTKDDCEPAPNEKQAIYEYYKYMCSTLSSDSPDTIQELFNSNNFSAQSIDFIQANYKFDSDNISCCIFCNEEIISFYCTENR